MKNYFLESERLYFRKMSENDFDIISSMLKDPCVMYAWEHDFSDEDVKEWITTNLERYKSCGLGYFIISDKFSGHTVGQAALMPDKIDGKMYYEIGYILIKNYWGNGYATEAAGALLNYAKLNYPDNEYILEIRPENMKSIRVAERLNAKLSGEFIKHVRGKEMKHFIYKLD